MPTGPRPRTLNACTRPLAPALSILLGAALFAGSEVALTWNDRGDGTYAGGFTPVPGVPASGGGGGGDAFVRWAAGLRRVVSWNKGKSYTGTWTQAKARTISMAPAPMQP